MADRRRRRPDHPAGVAALAGRLYTDSLWFSSVGYHNVFSTLLAIKLGLFGVFGAIFFVVLWVNLVVCDRIAGHDIVLAQEDELVRRYQQFVRPYAGRIYVALAFVLALIAASGTIGEWNNWILFRHGGNFGIKDPQFHKDVGFYVFKLPFLTFLVDWTLAILIVTLAVVGRLPLPQRRDPAPAGPARGCARRSRPTSRCSWRSSR